jgi:polysaccharide export outer membrane protein
MRNLACLLLLPPLLLLEPALAQDRLPAPADPGANLPARPLEPQDLVSINVYGAPELTRTVRVASDGTIRLPMLDQHIQVSGLMPPEAEDRVSLELIREHVLVDPAVTLTIAEYHNRPVSVVGAVRQPTTFPVYTKITLLEALARAQGLNEAAGSDILVTRPPAHPGEAPILIRVPVKGLIDAADPALNLELQGGEEVRVPEVGRVFVVGNVEKPGGFPAVDGNTITVLKALALAGGLTPFAKKEAFVFRHQADSASAPAQEIPVELRQILDRKSPDVALDPNDILYIPDSRTARASATVIEKAVAFVIGTASGALILNSTH